MDQLEITFSDLNEDAQKAMLEFLGIDTPRKVTLTLFRCLYWREKNKRKRWK